MPETSKNGVGQYPLSLDLIATVAEWGYEAELQTRFPDPMYEATNSSGSPYLDAFLQRHRIEVFGCTTWNGRMCLKLRRCPFNEEHKNGEAALLVSRQKQISFKCHHNSCADKNWQSFRNHFEPASQNHSVEWSEPSNGDESATIRIEDIPSLSSFQFEEIPFAIPGLIARGAITMLSGDPGSGKSTLASVMGAAAFLGGSFAGVRAEKSLVLILDRENPLVVVQERYRRCGISEGPGFHTWGPWFLEGAPAPDAACVMDWVKRNPNSIVIVDSLVRFMDGDENSAADVSQFMSRLRQITRLGAAVILIHHAGKGEAARNYRGSSDLSAAIDTGYKVTSLGNGRLEKLRLQAFKSRFTVISDLVLTYQDGQFIQERQSESSKTVTEKLTDLLRQHSGIRTSGFYALATEQGLGNERARRFIQVGVKIGLIRQVQGPHNAKFISLDESVHPPNELF